MTLKSEIGAHAASVFVNTDEFAEAVEVLGLDGGDRNVNAVVARESATAIRGRAHKTRDWTCTVAFIHDATPGSSATGVGFDEIRALEAAGRKWSIRLADDPDESAWSFLEVVNSDEGMITCRFKRPQIVSTGQTTPQDL